jgi:aminoglycoside phosphotransferase (APT) family kinase protein
MSDSFPVRLSELTPEWLSSVVGFEIVGFTATDLGVGKGMMGDIYRLRSTRRDGSEAVFVVKFSADREDLRATAKRSGIFEREINFYRHIAPELRCRIPKCFGTWYDGESAEFLIIMECIDADDSVSQITGISFTQAQLVMNELAALHVPESNFAHHRRYVSLVSAPERRTNQEVFIRNGWEKIRALAPENLRVPFSVDHMISKLLAAFDHLSALPFYLLHGDARPDNLLFSRDGGSVALIDWQGVALGPREWDLGYFLAQGLRVEDRRAWTNDLLDLYDSVSGADKTSTARSEMLVNIGKAAWFSFGVACALFTVADISSQKTIDLAASMGERSLSLLLDFGELES